MVEWSRALDVRLNEWCCSVSMVWVQIPSREEQKIGLISDVYIYIKSKGSYQQENLMSNGSSRHDDAAQF